MGKTVENITSTQRYRFLHPHNGKDVLASKETVVLLGDEKDPEVQQTKKRIEEAGRKVEVESTVCGNQNCTCTQPCKSFHFKSPAE